ncbi:Chitin synthase D [Lasiodiplodia hormozganensis]|uniref:chitin synthase n=1 Tax=Lasiodiplodia hormozganensis TaxID=869390 RepID=A0AA39W9I3_9PEZI|nr:Chitin synthase D [Lasiodiplodia hormozganensis]
MPSARSPDAALTWRPPVLEADPKLSYPIPVYTRGSSSAASSASLSGHDDSVSSPDEYLSSGWQTTRTSTRPSSVTDSEPEPEFDPRKRHLSPTRVPNPRSQLHQEIQRDEEPAPQIPPLAIEEPRKIITVPAPHPSHQLQNPLASHPRTPSAASSRQDVATITGVASAKEERFQALADCCNQMVAKTRPAQSPEFSKLGRRMITQQKLLLTGGLVCANFILIFATWWWPAYYYVYLPFITLTVALNCIMVASIIFHTIKHRIFPEKVIMPTSPESLVLLLPCYNENLEECTKSLDSLVAQKHLENHKRAIMIICDGRVRGAGMEKTTAQYLLEDILVEKTERKVVKQAYTAWDQQPMDVTVQKGSYKGTPYFCIIKHQNQGKRDGLIALRSFLYKYNTRAEKPQMLFRPAFFAEMAMFLGEDAGIDHVSHLVGMDADTVFADDCISELLKQSHYPNTVGVCGYVAVDFKSRNWNPWSLYQSSEYTISQGLRRLHQSIVTNKVSCLPGCCQLLKICEETCGDRVLVELFGYCPTPADNIIKQIRATASEDRNHVCLMLSARPQSKTRQALRARAMTDVPQSWSVFLSQRRRWTLGATANDLFLFKAPGVQWWERILAFANCMTWALNVFIFASLASLIHSILVVPWWIILAFASVMVTPLTYYLCITFWLPRTFRERVQYLAGCCLYVFCGPFINITVLFYAVWNMDSFGWGKTRKVISTDDSEEATPVPTTIPITTDIEAPPPTTLRPPHPSSSLHPEIIALVGCPDDTTLAASFGTSHRTLVYTPLDASAGESLARARTLHAHPHRTVEVTSDAARLRLAHIFVVVAATSASATEDALAAVFAHAARGSVVVVLESEGESEGEGGAAGKQHAVDTLLARCDEAGVVLGLAARERPWEVVVAGSEVGAAKVREVWERVRPVGARVVVAGPAAAAPESNEGKKRVRKEGGAGGVGAETAKEPVRARVEEVRTVGAV